MLSKLDQKCALFLSLCTDQLRTGSSLSRFLASDKNKRSPSQSFLGVAESMFFLGIVLCYGYFSLSPVFCIISFGNYTIQTSLFPNKSIDHKQNTKLWVEVHDNQDISTLKAAKITSKLLEPICYT